MGRADRNDCAVASYNNSDAQEYRDEEGGRGRSIYRPRIKRREAEGLYGPQLAARRARIISALFAGKQRPEVCENICKITICSPWVGTFRGVKMCSLRMLPHDEVKPFHE